MLSKIQPKWIADVLCLSSNELEYGFHHNRQNDHKILKK